MKGGPLQKLVVLSVVWAVFAACAPVTGCKRPFGSSREEQDFLGAVQDGDLQAAREFVRRSVNVNARTDDGCAFGPLHIAVLKKPSNLAMVDFLVTHGADLDLRDSLGKTPLHYAATQRDDVDIVEFLLAHGADPHAVDQLGHSPLDVAQAMGCEQAIKAMRKYISSK